ncbi:hypothetical protein Mapa_002401 [Marchantia paleacea]|nr:hypothetical protein Mapa_002401 [Marchantia paleacea]
MLCRTLEGYADDSYEPALEILAAMAQYDGVGQAIPAVTPTQLITCSAKLSTATILKKVLVDDETVQSHSFALIVKSLVTSLRDWDINLQVAVLSLEALLAISLAERGSPSVVHETRMKMVREGGIRAILQFYRWQEKLTQRNPYSCLNFFACTMRAGQRSPATVWRCL